VLGGRGGIGGFAGFEGVGCNGFANRADSMMGSKVRVVGVDSFTKVPSGDFVRNITTTGKCVSALLVLTDLAVVEVTLGDGAVADKVIV